MATSQIILLEPIPNLGDEGEQVTVRAGFARNFLLPRKKALPINRANKKQIESLLQSRANRKAKELEQANALKNKLSSISIAIPVKTGTSGKIFGAVTIQDLIKRFSEEGLVFDKKQISLPLPAKNLGKHSARIKLHPDIIIDFEFEVVSENPIEETPQEN